MDDHSNFRRSKDSEKLETRNWKWILGIGHCCRLEEFTDEESYVPILDLNFNEEDDLLPEELRREQCEPKDIRYATGLLESMVAVMAEVLVGREGKLSPFDLFPGGSAKGKPKGKPKGESHP